MLEGGPGQGFEPWQKAPQASRLPSYLTPATFQCARALLPINNDLVIVIFFFPGILSCPLGKHIQFKYRRLFSSRGLQEIDPKAFQNSQRTIVFPQVPLTSSFLVMSLEG